MSARETLVRGTAVVKRKRERLDLDLEVTPSPLLPWHRPGIIERKRLKYTWLIGSLTHTHTHTHTCSHIKHAWPYCYIRADLLNKINTVIPRPIVAYHLILYNVHDCIGP